MHFYGWVPPVSSLQVFIFIRLVTAATLGTSELGIPDVNPPSLPNKTQGWPWGHHDAVLSKHPEPSIALVQGIKNETHPHLILPHSTIASANGFVPFKIPKSFLTMYFYDFGVSLPVSEVLISLNMALRIPLAEIRKLHGERPIPNGYFRFTQEFNGSDSIVITLGDFREIGLPITYYTLCDVIRGIGLFMMVPEQGYMETRFEVENKGSGHVGSGRIGRVFGPTATANVA